MPVNKALGFKIFFFGLEEITHFEKGKQKQTEVRLRTKKEANQNEVSLEV